MSAKFKIHLIWKNFAWYYFFELRETCSRYGWSRAFLMSKCRVTPDPESRHLPKPFAQFLKKYIPRIYKCVLWIHILRLSHLNGVASLCANSRQRHLRVLRPVLELSLWAQSGSWLPLGETWNSDPLIEPRTLSTSAPVAAGADPGFWSGGPAEVWP